MNENPNSSNVEELRQWLLSHLNLMVQDSGFAREPNFSDYDLYTLDYVEMARGDLQLWEQTSVQLAKASALMGCTANLKRALDCQLNCFLHHWNLSRTFAKKSGGINGRVEWLGRAGLFDSRSIRRFVTFRNKLEHEFQNPDIADIEAIFDLVIAFVWILQNVIGSSWNSVVLLNDDSGEYLSAEYKDDLPSVVFTHGLEKPVTTWEFAASNEAEFTYGFRAFMVLHQLNSFPSFSHAERILKQP
jgi:hypothetical protein